MWHHLFLLLRRTAAKPSWKPLSLEEWNWQIRKESRTAWGALLLYIIIALGIIFRYYSDTRGELWTALTIALVGAILLAKLGEKGIIHSFLYRGGVTQIANEYGDEYEDYLKYCQEIERLEGIEKKKEGKI